MSLQVYMRAPLTRSDLYFVAILAVAIISFIIMAKD